MEGNDAYLTFNRVAENSYHYYLPYFISNTNYWSGLGLTNCNSSQAANIIVTVFENSGQPIATENKSILANGQAVFVVGSGLSANGWLKVSSTQSLTGLSFFGTKGSGNYISDITLIPALSTTLFVPHVAQNDEWDTTVMICNPNLNANNVTISYVDKNGNTQQTTKINIEGNGSTQFGLDNFSSSIGSLSGGHVKIFGSKGIAAFALYTNLKSGGYSYAGISAVDPLNQ